MQTDSSARRTYLASASATECTATVLIPSSRQARWTRRAISPRFAISIFSNMRDSGWAVRHGAGRAVLSDYEQWLAVFDRLAVFDQDFLDDATLVSFDFVQQFHRFDD